MKFATAALLSLSGAAVAASTYTTSPVAPTKAPCPTGDGYMSTDPMYGDVAPPTAPPAPTKTPCPTAGDAYKPGSPTSGKYPPGSPTSGTAPPTGGYKPGSPTSGTVPSTGVYTPTPTPEVYVADPPTPPKTSPKTPDSPGPYVPVVPEEPCDKDTPSSPPYTGTTITTPPAAETYAVRTSVRQGITYTDENGVTYFQDASGQWYYYPSPTPAPTMAPTPVPDGSFIMIDDLEAESTGDNTVTVGTTEDKAAGSANGLNGALAAALVSPGAPGAIGLAF